MPVNFSLKPTAPSGNHLKASLRQPPQNTEYLFVNAVYPPKGCSKVSGPYGTPNENIQFLSQTRRTFTYASPFESHYENTLRYDLAEKLCVNNSHQTPKIEKIILSASVSFKPQQVRGPGVELTAGQVLRSPKNKSVSKAASFGSKAPKGKKMPIWTGQGLEDCTVEVRKALILLSGQTLDAKLFRVGRPHLGIRKGRLAAYQVTLRNQSIYFFLERLLSEVLPKVIKMDPAVLITSAVDRRLQRTSMKVADFKISDYRQVPLSAI